MRLFFSVTVVPTPATTMKKRGGRGVMGLTLSDKIHYPNVKNGTDMKSNHCRQLDLNSVHHETGVQDHGVRMKSLSSHRYEPSTTGVIAPYLKTTTIEEIFIASILCVCTRLYEGESVLIRCRKKIKNAD